MRYLATLLVGLWLTTFSFGQNPEQKVLGADNPVQLGSVVLLKLSDPLSVGPNFEKFSADWRVYDASGKEVTVLPWNDNAIVFGSGVVKQRFNVLVAVSYLYVTRENDVIKKADVKTRFLTASVNAGGVEPDPNPPGPGPNPPPTPTFPDGKFKLSKWSFDKASTLVDAKFKDKAVALSVNYTGIASAIAAGAIKTSKEALEEIGKKNRESLGEAGVEGWSKFFLGLQDEVFNLYKDKKLVTVQDFADAFREIAAGLREVK